MFDFNALALLASASNCWQLPAIAGNCWLLLAIAGYCWLILVAAGCCAASAAVVAVGSFFSCSTQMCGRRLLMCMIWPELTPNLAAGEAGAMHL